MEQQPIVVITVHVSGSLDKGLTAAMPTDNVQRRPVNFSTKRMNCFLHQRSSQRHMQSTNQFVTLNIMICSHRSLIMSTHTCWPTRSHISPGV